MTLLLRDTNINRRSILSLARSLSREREAFLQLLLELCENKTFRRIASCPTYPVKAVTPDLEERRNLFCESVASDPYEISFALAFLYEAVAEEKLRKRLGQYFTPAYIARRAIDHMDLRGGEIVLDPGCGTGIFPLVTLRKLEKGSKNPLTFGYLGIERDPLLALSAALSLDWVDAPSSWQILYANYLDVHHEDLEKLLGKGRKINAIVCNPPFVRYQKLGERSELATKLHLNALSGLHSFFLAHSSKLVKGGRMLFIIPTEMKGTQYGTTQLGNLESKFKLEINEIVYYQKSKHTWNNIEPSKISLEMHTKIKQAWNLTLFSPILENETELKIPRGAPNIRKPAVPLGYISSVHRGISTGANHFFVITDKVANEMGVSEKKSYLRRVIPTKLSKKRLQKVFGDKDWQTLREEGKPCWLLSLPRARKTPFDDLPIGVRQYLRKGERLGIHLIPTCRSRKPWYYVGIPRVPDLFFTYISRGYPVFVYNKARVLNLTNLLRVHLKLPAIPSEDNMIKLVELLNNEIRNWIDQRFVGRRYKGGLVKFEPRDLEKMPISEYALNELRIGFRSLAINDARA